MATRYTVRVQRLAQADLNAAFERVRRVAPISAMRWLNRFEKAIQTLELNSQRCPLAKVGGRFDVKVHEFLFGKRPNVFRVLYLIDEDCGRILRIRRGQRQQLSREELENSLEDDG